jgi:hypothetical protein
MSFEWAKKVTRLNRQIHDPKSISQATCMVSYLFLLLNSTFGGYLYVADNHSAGGVTGSAASLSPTVVDVGQQDKESSM